MCVAPYSNIVGTGDSFAEAVEDWHRQNGNLTEDEFLKAAETELASVIEEHDTMFPSDPDARGGWTIDYRFLQQIQDKIGNHNEGGYVALETIEDVILAYKAVLNDPLINT